MMQMLNLVLLSMLLSPTLARKMCDMEELGAAMEACSATVSADASEDRLNCACTESIPLEHRNCYVGLNGEHTLQEEYELHCGANLEAKEAIEAQVGIVSSLFGSCGDPSQAHCTDVASSKGCAAHWVTHKSQYKNKCGWWWSRPCDRCCEAKKNIVDVGTDEGVGGLCTCPDGFTYNVGAASNCIDGVVGPSQESSDKTVTCNADYVPKVMAKNALNMVGCGDDDMVCGFTYLLDQTLGLSKDIELGHSKEREAADADGAEEEEDDGSETSASVSGGVSLSAGASTRVTTNIKGSLIWDESGDWDDTKLKVELLNSGFYMDSKVVLGLTAGAEFSYSKKISVGPQLKKSKIIRFRAIPILVDIKAQPVVTVSVSGNIAASATFTLENVAAFTFSDMFVQLDMKTREASQNLDAITATKAYSDMYTLDLAGEIGLEVKAVLGVEIEFMIYNTIGVALTPAIETKFTAAGEASFKQRWSSSTFVPPIATNYGASATVCVGATVETGLTWAGAEDGAELEDAIAEVKHRLAPLELQNRRRKLSAASEMQKACHDAMQCTMGFLGSAFSSICELDFAELLSSAGLGLGTPTWFAGLTPPSMTVPLAEQCYTVGVDNGEFYSRQGDASEVDCGGGNIGVSCANCMAFGSCGGDCALRDRKCVPQEEEYGLFPGGTCGKGYEAITSSWQACNLAGQGLSYPAEKLTNIQADYSAAFGTDKPQGCFMDGEDKVLYYNRNSGPTHGTNFEYGDAIICKKPETAVGYLAMLGLSDSALGFSSEKGSKDKIVVFFAMIGFFAVIVAAYRKAFPSKYTTIPMPMVEEI